MRDHRVNQFPEDAPVFVISVAAQLAGMHAQTLRQYDRLGLVNPSRTPGGGRRYSARDVALLREVQRLSQEEGVNLAGIKRIIALEEQVEALQGQVEALLTELEQARSRPPRWWSGSQAVGGSQLFASQKLSGTGSTPGSLTP